MAGTDRRGADMAGILDGKVALVTGAGKNIGRAIALHLARDGAAVVVNGRADQAAVEAVAGEIAAMGGRAVAHLADVSDPAAVARMVEAAAATFGGIDIAVSNAGLRRQTPFLDMPLAEWREILSVALDGAFVLAQAVVPHMIRRGGGAIVGLSGVSTHIGTPNRAHVSASKAGLEGLMRSLAVELAPHGIRCNCVAPGTIDTVRGASAGARPGTLGEGAVPLRRRGTPDEIAAVVRMLVGPEGGYVTGQTVHVNGGVFLT
jgi:3-oxoacyl-[acyl-carrier protein] reductase